MAIAQIVLGDTNQLRINLLGHRPGSGSCLRVKLSARVDSLRCSCVTGINREALGSLREQMATMDSNLASDFSIIFDRGEVLRGSANQRGHIVIEFHLKATGTGQLFTGSGQWTVSGSFVSYPDFLARAVRQCDEALVRLR